MNSFSISHLISETTDVKQEDPGSEAGTSSPPPATTPSETLSPHSVEGTSRESDPSLDSPDSDVSLDKAGRPQFSYTALIVKAIRSRPDERIKLCQIYEWIAHKFPYYQMEKTDWKNSIRHNLSMQKIFRKVPDSGSKGCYWTLDPNHGRGIVISEKSGKIRNRPSPSFTSTPVRLPFSLRTPNCLPLTPPPDSISLLPTPLFPPLLPPAHLLPPPPGSAFNPVVSPLVMAALMNLMMQSQQLNNS